MDLGKALTGKSTPGFDGPSRMATVEPLPLGITPCMVRSLWRGGLLSKLCRLATIGLFSAMVMMATQSTASAQTMEAPQVEAGPKGLIGLGLIGAEVGMVVPALAGLDDTWAFLVFPALGAAGGAVAGHFLIDQNNNEDLAIGMLVTGVALVVPSLVLTLVSTAYDPDDEVSEGPDFGDEFDGDTEVDVEEEAARRLENRRVALDRRQRAGTGLLRLSDGAATLALPGISVMPTYSARELALFGGQQRTEVRLSLLSGSF